MDKLFPTQGEAFQAATDWKAASERRRLPIVPCSDPLHATWGFLVLEERLNATHPWHRSDPSKTVRFLFPRFDRTLEAVAASASPEELTEAMLAAKDGLYAQGDDADKLLIRACVYDLDRGLAFIFESTTRQLAGLSGKFRDAWLEKDWKRRSKRDALGGYSNARSTKFQELHALLQP